MNENKTFNDILRELIGTVTKIKAADTTNSSEAKNFLKRLPRQMDHFNRVKGYNDNDIKRHLTSLKSWKRQADAILDELTVQTESKATTKSEETTKSSEPTALSIRFNKELTNLQATIAKVRAADTPEAKSFLEETLESMEMLEGSKNYEDHDLTPSLFKTMSNYQKNADAILDQMASSESAVAQFKEMFARFKATVKKVKEEDTDYAPEINHFQMIIDHLNKVKDYNGNDIKLYLPGLRAAQKYADATVTKVIKTRADIKATIASEKVALKAAIEDVEAIIATVEKHKAYNPLNGESITTFKEKLVIYKEYATSYEPEHYNKAGADEIRNIRLNKISVMREGLITMQTLMDEDTIEANLKVQFAKKLAQFKTTIAKLKEADTTNAYEAEVKSYEAWIEELDATTTSEAYLAELARNQKQADDILAELAFNEKVAQVSTNLKMLKNQILKLEKSYKENKADFVLASGKNLYDAEKINTISVQDIARYEIAEEFDLEYFVSDGAEDIASDLAYVTSVLNQVAKNKVAIAKKAELEKTESTKSATSEQGLISASVQYKQDLAHLKVTIAKIEKADKTNSPEATHFLTILPREIDHLDKIKNYNDNDIKIYLPGLSKLQKRADTILAELTGQTESKAITKSEETTKSAEPTAKNIRFNKQFAHLQATTNKIKEADTTNVPGAKHFLTVIPGAIQWLGSAKNYKDKDLVEDYFTALSHYQELADKILAKVTASEATFELSSSFSSAKFKPKLADLKATIAKIEKADTTNVPEAKEFLKQVPSWINYFDQIKNNTDKNFEQGDFDKLSEWQGQADAILVQTLGASAQFKQKLVHFKTIAAKLKEANTESIPEASHFIESLPGKIERLERVKDYNDTDIKRYLTKLNEWQGQADAILVQTLGASAQFKQKLVHFKTTAAKLKEADTTNSPEASHFIGSLSGKIERLERVKDYNDTDIKVYLTRLNEWQSQADAILDKLAVQEAQVSGNELKTAIAVRPNATTNHQKIATGLGLTLAPLAIIIVAIGTRLLAKLKRNKNQAGSRK